MASSPLLAAAAVADEAEDEQEQEDDDDDEDDDVNEGEVPLGRRLGDDGGAGDAGAGRADSTALGGAAFAEVVFVYVGNSIKSTMRINQFEVTLSLLS